MIMMMEGVMPRLWWWWYRGRDFHWHRLRIEVVIVDLRIDRLLVVELLLVVRERGFRRL